MAQDLNQIAHIVRALQSEPFRMKLTLVDFDSKSPVELLQLAADVFAELDKTQKRDVRDGSPVPEHIEAMKKFVLNLQGKKKPWVPAEDLEMGLTNGDPNVIYPILFQILSNFDRLAKRAYVARFLVPIDIPKEYLYDEGLAPTNTEYIQLRAQFKELHKEADEIRKQDVRPSEIKQEITQLEVERKQLHARIDKLKGQTDNETGFPALLQATSELRKAQDEEASLHDKMRKQRVALHGAQAQHADAQRAVGELKQQLDRDADPGAMLDSMRRETSHLTMEVTSQLPTQIAEKRQLLDVLYEQNAEPVRSQGELEELGGEVSALQRRNGQMLEAINNAMEDSGNSTLKMTTNRVRTVMAKVAKKEDSLGAYADEKKELEMQAASLEHRNAALSGGSGMTREQHTRFVEGLRAKTADYRPKKAALSATSSELVVLHRTAQILRERDANYDDFLNRQEKKRGVEGFRETQAKLEAAAEQASFLNSAKEATLDEISDMVMRINAEIKSKKAELSPMMEELRKLRNKYRRVKQDYADRKKAYDNVAVGLEMDRGGLERDCDVAQEECLQEESRYHYLNSLVALATVQLKRAEDEDNWKRGKGRLSQNFRCYEDVFTDKQQRMEQLSQQLRRKKAEIERTEDKRIAQRTLFADAVKLLKGRLVAFGGDDPGAMYGSADVGMGGSETMVMG